MGFATRYLEKHQFLLIDIPRVSPDAGLLKYIVILPAYCEPEIFKTLQSLIEANKPDCRVEVFILVNFSDADSPTIAKENKELHTSL